jgi:outer membrane protein
MQKILIGLNVVLLAAVIFLFTKVYETKGTNEPVVSIIKKPALKDGKALKIAYIDADSLLKNFEFFKKNKAEYESKAERAERSLEEKAKKIEAEYLGYQQRAQSMTQEQLKMAEQSLMQKQQELAKEKDRITKQLLQEEEKLNKDLRDRVNNYMKAISEKNGLDYVFSYQKGGTMIFGKSDFDITAQVIEDLNKSFKEEKK